MVTTTEMPVAPAETMSEVREVRSKHDRGLPPRSADLRELRRLEGEALAAVADYKAAIKERRRLA